MSKLCGNPLQAPVAHNVQATYSAVEPSEHNGPPIPGLSQPSKPHEDALTCEHEPEVALTQSMEEPFGYYFHLGNNHQQYAHQLPPPSAPKNPTASSPHSHNEAQQEFTNLQPTLIIPKAIIHDSINQILLEHHQFLQMIPFVDATHQNEMHREFWEELNTRLGQAVKAYPKEDINGIVSRFFKK
ncbi:hypothetical protein O181_100769 [Austropuccinia psidii MF-1]|uniref:Uncharacterized protein n=1 Tax=Austropuccinia psidii MF-1 TaxID=1389203 RepID=A0A9Q3JFV5_9BASI|nr:hypothetical protein [Austropuccinia psidii MF-1]